jgi:uncharacterized protein
MIVKLSLWALALATGLVAAAYFGQRRLMYHPNPQRVPPVQAGLLNVSEVVISAPDGARIIHWWGPPQPGQPTILYFHGNAGGLYDRSPRIERFMSEGWGVLMMSYRGFSGSEGSPTEIDNVADAMRAFDHLVAQGSPAGEIILYGESLGTGVATQVAVQRRARGLILESPYTSTVDVGARQFPFLPVSRAMHDRYETVHFIGQIGMPLLVLHGLRDRVIPVEMGREVARLASEPKTYVEFPVGGHVDLYIGGNNAMDHVRAWVANLPRR